jgi:hypothetical protein
MSSKKLAPNLHSGHESKQTVNYIGKKIRVFGDYLLTFRAPTDDGRRFAAAEPGRSPVPFAWTL